MVVAALASSQRGVHHPPQIGPNKPMLKFFVLGRFEVARDGRPVTAWGGRQTRDFVTALVAARGRPLARDELVELLWTE